MRPAFAPLRGRKVCRAHGGCLGAGSRRRTREAAIVPGEPHSGFDPGVSEWGNPAGEGPLSRMGRQPGELKHLSTPRKGNQTETPPVAASERGPAQTGASVEARERCRTGVEGAHARGPRSPAAVTKPSEERKTHGKARGTGLEPRTRHGRPAGCAAQSTAGHEEPGGKQGGPPPKAKHSPATDSGRVP